MYHRNTRNSNPIIMTQSDYTLTPKGRFAPSPSGRMHLGNLFSALISWLSVKSRGGNWVLRIEDLDPGRSRQQHADRIMSDLEWLGLTWDEGPYYQSRRHDLYAEALRSLEATGLTGPPPERWPHSLPRHLPPPSPRLQLPPSSPRLHLPRSSPALHRSQAIHPSDGRGCRHHIRRPLHGSPHLQPCPRMR